MEVQDKGQRLAREDPVHPRQGLDCLHVIQPLVDVHAAQQRLVKAGLELVGYQENAVFIGVESLLDQVFLDLWRASIHVTLVGVLDAVLGVADLAGVGHQRFEVHVNHGGHVLVKFLFVSHSRFTAARHDHCLGLTVEQVHHVLAEMLDDHRYLLANAGRVQRHVSENFLARLCPVKLYRFVDRLIKARRALPSGDAAKAIGYWRTSRKPFASAFVNTS